MNHFSIQQFIKEGFKSSTKNLSFGRSYFGSVKPIPVVHATAWKGAHVFQNIKLPFGTNSNSNTPIKRFYRSLCTATTTPSINTPIIERNIINTAIPKDFEVPVVNWKGEEISKTKLSWKIFGVPLRKDILHRVVIWQLAKRRQGTHKAKRVSEVHGSNKKPWPQKGQGRARAGSRRAPQFRKGGRAHPPVPRSHAFNLPKEVRQFGLKVALSTKLAQGKLVVVNEAKLDTHKTVNFKILIQNLGWKTALVVGGEEVDKNLQLASGASLFYRIQVLPQKGINVYSILHKETLVLSLDSIKYLNGWLLH